MGGCVPKPPSGFALPRLTGTLIPDVSEYQSCRLYSEAIFRVYEAGTGREDSTAYCHAQELHRLHAWAAVYSFLRPGNCSSQAARTIEIVKSLPVEVQAVVADAEVSLPPGCVVAFERTVRAAGWPAVEYTCPGCGVELVHPIWIAAYPFRPAGVWVAHQFTDNFNCRGVRGDCSINEGILSIRRAVKPVPKPTSRTEELERRILLLRADLTKRHCRVIHGPHAYRLCPRWAAEGRQAHRELRSLL